MIGTETPEEALQELKNSANADDILWSGGTPLGIESGRVEYIRRTQNAIEMAHEYAKSHQKEEVKLPDEFKRHAALFSDEEAKKFPPS